MSYMLSVIGIIFFYLACVVVSSHTDAIRATDMANWQQNYNFLFESLREQIYAEVASLISHNETQPHYLVELFRRLQLLTTEDQRQQVMASVERIASQCLIADSDDHPSITLLHPPGIQRSVSYSFDRPNFAALALTLRFCLGQKVEDKILADWPVVDLQNSLFASIK